jgi:hypothetical protein
MYASIAVHIVSNFLLHTLTGLDGGNKALLMPFFEKNWPQGYDLGFAITISSAIITLGLLLLLIVILDRKYMRYAKT